MIAGSSSSGIRRTGDPGDSEASPLAVDLLLAGYLALTGGLALSSLTGLGAALAAAHGLAIWVVLGPLPAAGRRHLQGATGAGTRVLSFLRMAYPVLLTPLLYTELGYLNQLHVAGYFDPTVQAWEEALFGAQLSVVWAERQPWRWLSELMHAGYFSYYFIIPLSALIVFARGRARAVHRFTVITGLGFFLCYLVFTVFPVAGPRYLYEQIQGTPARALFFEAVHAIAEGASAKGTAFPSSHVAATVAGWLACRRTARRWFRASAPFVVLLTLGTVYGRFHYAVDALAGLAVAAVAWRAGAAMSRLREPAGGD